MTLHLRPADQTDMDAITRIYGHAVVHGTSSFELEPPEKDVMTQRWRAVVDAGYPWLVANASGNVAGYAYAGAYRPRPAYRFAVEDSIYVDPAFHGRGVGRALLMALIDTCEAMGMRRMVAVIGDSDSRGSIALHRACGFTPAGVVPAVGWKHGRWLDQVLMHRPLGRGDEAPPA